MGDEADRIIEDGELSEWLGEEWDICIRCSKPFYNSDGQEMCEPCIEATRR